MGRKSRQEKLAEYVLEGSVSKVKRFMKEHKRIDINSVRLVIHKYQPLLHMACERGYRMMMITLLQAGADPALLDHTKGDTALHVAMRRVLSGHPTDFKPIALTILKYSPSDILDIENKSGQTARHLLKRFVTERGMTIGRKVRAEEEAEWKEKMSSAWEDDMTDNLPDHGYYQGFGEENQQESFDDWADRLATEYRQKKHGGYEETQPEQETESRNKKRKNQEEKSKKIKPNKRQRGQDGKNHILLMRLRYEKKMAAFEADKTENVTFDSIPWPGSTDNTDHMVTILVSDKSKMSREDFKKYLRTHQRTWHPDKFLQKFGERLKESERERILEKVKELSQALNKAGEEDEKKHEWDY